MEAKTSLSESSIIDDNDYDYEDNVGIFDDLSKDEPIKDLFEFTDFERA